MGDEIVKTLAVAKAPASAAVTTTPAVAKAPVEGAPKSKKWLYWVGGAVVVVAIGLLVWKFIL